jgi:hypothetical protein
MDRNPCYYKTKARKEASAMNDVFVTALDGTKLMPTSRYKARKLLRAGKAVIA